MLLHTFTGKKYKREEDTKKRGQEKTFFKFKSKIPYLD